MRRAFGPSRRRSSICKRSLAMRAGTARAQFGTKEHTEVIPTAGFTPTGPRCSAYFNEGYTYFQVSQPRNPATFVASTATFPSARRSTQVCAFVRDDDPAGEVQLRLLRRSSSATVAAGSHRGDPRQRESGRRGDAPLRSALRHSARGHDDPGRRRRRRRSHVARIPRPTASPSVCRSSDKLAFGGALVKWQRRQRSPAPVTATFSDVPTDFLFFRAIESAGGVGDHERLRDAGQLLPQRQRHPRRDRGVSGEGARL